MSGSDTLAAIRQRIDALDDRLLDLLSQRGALAREVAEAKRAEGETADFYRPERERAIVQRLLGRNPGPLADETVTLIFKELMSACLALQQPLRVAFLGPEGTFTQAAAVKQFGHGALLVPLSGIDAVFREVESGNSRYGVVPVENSTEGVVNHTLDCFLDSPLQIVGEVELRIQHQLLVAADSGAAPGDPGGSGTDRATALGRIRTVYSHPQGLAQCRTWLERNLPAAGQVAVASTAEAARRAAEEAGSAAIASAVAAETYGLAVAAPGIEDRHGNTTRFLVIGDRSPAPSGDDKTSLVVSRNDQPGGLVALLQPLSDEGINMTRLDARPSRQGIWDYAFFIDLLGHGEDPAIQRALGRMREQASLFRVLGSYPRVTR